MLKIGDNTYPLVGLDTNVLSAIALDRGNVRRGFFAKLIDHIACFSPYSLFELRQHSQAYEAFIELFDVVPCMLLKNEEQLFEEERKRYPGHQAIDPTLLAFSLLNRSKGTNLRNILETGMSAGPVQEREAAWPDLKKELLADWVSLKPNFEPKGESFTPLDGVRFVDEATWQHVAFRAPKWSRRRLKRGDRIQSEAFPSVRMILWTIFFRLYWAHRRHGEVQDVFDALISAPAPYLDAVVTENFQARIYRDVQKLDPTLLNLSVHTLGDLEAAGRHALQAD